MLKSAMILLVLGALLAFGCAGQTKTETTYDEGALPAPEEPHKHNEPAEHRMPESPKVKADDMER